MSGDFPTYVIKMVEVSFVSLIFPVGCLHPHLQLINKPLQITHRGLKRNFSLPVLLTAVPSGRRLCDLEKTAVRPGEKLDILRETRGDFYRSISYPLCDLIGILWSPAVHFGDILGPAPLCWGTRNVQDLPYF